MTARLSGLLLLGLGLAGVGFALLGEYQLLMNPDFRWITVLGACLLLAMGVALLVKPAGGSVGALVVFALFFALVALARPHEGGVAPLLGLGDVAHAIDRAGYEPVRLQTLFKKVDQDTPELADQQAAMRGVVKRLAELDGEVTFVLLEPMMACCLADAVAFGVRVKGTRGSLPEDGSWVYAFGVLHRLDVPVATPEFRLGAILFNPVCRTRQLTAHEVVPLHELLEDLFEKTPEDFASTFRSLMVESGVADTLREEGPFTVFAVHDAAFKNMSVKEREALLNDRGALRRFLNDMIVPGRYTKSDLYEVTSLTTFAGTTLSVRLDNAWVRIGGARILLGPLTARNGLVYVVHQAPRHDGR